MIAVCLQVRPQLGASGGASGVTSDIRVSFLTLTQSEFSSAWYQALVLFKLTRDSLEQRKTMRRHYFFLTGSEILDKRRFDAPGKSQKFL